MTEARYPHKAAAPSVRPTIGSAIERARGLSQKELRLSREQLVEDIIAKLDLPPVLEADLRQRSADADLSVPATKINKVKGRPAE